jgi:putative SOS response-associated peptidase YedK
MSTINARSETVVKTATYREPFKKRRCLVPADGYFEWAKNDLVKEGAKPLKVPYSFSLRTGETLAFAGLWDAWRDPDVRDSPWLQSFTILTTEGNAITAPVHNRMPVILPERDWARWLSREEDERPPVDLLRPYDSDAMRRDACNPAVGSVKNNGPEMLRCPNPPGTEQLNSK